MLTSDYQRLVDLLEHLGLSPTDVAADLALFYQNLADIGRRDDAAQHYAAYAEALNNFSPIATKG